MKKYYCCDNFRKYLSQKKIINTKIDGIPAWIIPNSFRIYRCPFCSKFITSKEVPEAPHTEYPVSLTKKINALAKTIENKKYCCSRFAEWVKEGNFIYAYKRSKAIDETQWIIDGLFHMYYCPFCGTYIKGKGFGTPVKPYNK